MFCKKCGNEIPDGAKFCKKCGSPISSINNNSNELKDESDDIKTIDVSKTEKRIRLNIL